MPELPEVETIRRGLEILIGKTIINFEILSKKRHGGSFIGNIKNIVGKKIISVSRHGKQILIGLSNNYFLVIHLKMTGQLIYLPLSSKVDKYTRLIFTFSDHSHLFFNDLRKFGWIRLIKVGDLKNFQKDLGVDLLDDNFTFQYFYSQLQKTSRSIKTVLLDQSLFAGIGNIYANEALFLAKIHPLSKSNKIPRIQAKNLYNSILQVINEAISHGGSTAKDKGFVKSNGQEGGHQYFFRVYQKENEKCPGCHSLIKRIKVNGRSSFYCPKCQKLY